MFKMKKTTLLLPLIILSLIAITPETLAKNEKRVIPASQNIKVQTITFNSGKSQSAEKLEKVLLEQLSMGWEYDYNIDMSEDMDTVKLLVFKRIIKAK